MEPRPLLVSLGLVEPCKHHLVFCGELDTTKLGEVDGVISAHVIGLERLDICVTVPPTEVYVPTLELPVNALRIAIKERLVRFEEDVKVPCAAALRLYNADVVKGLTGK
jgi:hypothetical protein